jgi:hypothetical protein
MKMLKNSRIKHIVLYVSLILLGMLISTSVLNSRATGQVAPVLQDTAPNSETVAPNQPAAPTSPNAEWSKCTPLNVAVFSSRVHVKCVEIVGGIQYFAASTANAANAARLLSLLNTAHVSGRQLDILYEPSDTSGAAIGCAASDCRLILGAGILQ